MRIEIVKIENENGEFSIWIDREQNFSLAHFLKDISFLNIGAPKTIYQSFGPAEVIEKYSTKIGDFYINQEFDEYTGTTIYSESSKLMNKIYFIYERRWQWQIP